METIYDNNSYKSDYSVDKSIYQSDARIFHQPGLIYDPVMAVSAARFAAGTLTADAILRSGAVARLSLTPISEGTLRLRFWQDPALFDETSVMLVAQPQPAPDTVFEITDTGWSLHFDGYSLHLLKDPFGLSIHDSAGRVLMELETETVAGDFVTPPLGLRDHGTAREPFLSWRLHNQDRFYGLGEKWDKVEKTGSRATIWNVDTCGTNTTDLSYKAVPVLFCSAGWGVMLHSSWRSFWEIGTFSYTSGSVLTEDPKLDAFLFLAPTVKGLIERYTALTGRPALPPTWAFGIWMSRCAYQNRAQVDGVLARLRAENIPVDVIHLDPPWMSTHYYPLLNVDACDFQWDEMAWHEHAAMIQQWKDQGIYTCLWINPYLPEGTPIYDEAKNKGYLARNTGGEIARLERGEPVGTVDFTNPDAKAWWQSYLRTLMAEGVAVFKPDYGDRVAEESLFFNGRTGREMHNLFLFLYTQAVAEVVQEERGESIVWRRPGYIGSQRYPGTWAGDTQVSWEAMRCCLRGGLSAGLTGDAFWGHDIGGFVGPRPEPELYIRWAQWGLLSPLARFHGNTPREPWEYGEIALAVVRHYAHLRYTLIPYLLQCAQETSQTGVPMMRHMALEFPDEPGIEHLDDQYLLGPHLLVAPVLDAGLHKRAVYFPDGTWVSWDDPAQVFEGPRYHTVPAPLERLPLFARAGASIPTFAAVPSHLKGALPPIIKWSY